MGKITARLYEKETPITVENFVALAQGKKATRSAKTGKLVTVPLYDNITFHRVVPGEMIQSGDPTGTGTHNCGFTIRDEFLPGLRFDSGGRLAMANTGNPDSGGCQFFITTNAMRAWNGKYTIFGVVVEGQDVVERINRGPVHDDQPVEPGETIDGDHRKGRAGAGEEEEEVNRVTCRKCRVPMKELKGHIYHKQRKWQCPKCGRVRMQQQK